MNQPFDEPKFAANRNIEVDSASRSGLHDSEQDLISEVHQISEDSRPEEVQVLPKVFFWASSKC